MLSRGAATLVVRASGGCKAKCPFCPWNLNEVGPSLSEESLEVVVDALLGSGFRPDIFFICPDPLENSRLSSLIEASKDRGLKTTVLVPASTKSEDSQWHSLLLSDEVFIASYGGEHLREANRLVRFLLTQGVTPKILALISPGSRLEDLESIISRAQRWGLELWVSTPILCPPSTCPVDLIKLLKSWGFHVTDAVGTFLHVYRVRVAFKGDYHMRVVEGPLCGSNCRLLYLSPEGLVGKCPAGTLAAVNSPVEFAVLVQKGCTNIVSKTDYAFVTSVKLVTKGGAEIGERDLDLLALVEEAGSLSGAARMAGLSPPSVLRRIKKMEEKLGFRLIIPKRGGIDRGGVLLTPEARELVRKFRAVKSASSIVSRFK